MRRIGLPEIRDCLAGGAPISEADLSGVDLSGEDLAGAIFIDVVGALTPF